MILNSTKGFNSASDADSKSKMKFRAVKSRMLF